MILPLQKIFRQKLIDYLLGLIEKTRNHPDILLGASPRAAVLWLQASQARAWLTGRDYLIPDDFSEFMLENKVYPTEIELYLIFRDFDKERVGVVTFQRLTQEILPK